MDASGRDLNLFHFLAAHLADHFHPLFDLRDSMASDTKSVAQENLRRGAESCGVAAHRLIFAPKIRDMTDHLARHRHADLFSTRCRIMPHSSASDALWAGLPMLICLGSTFAGRVAASLLREPSILAGGRRPDAFAVQD